MYIHSFFNSVKIVAGQANKTIKRVFCSEKLLSNKQHSIRIYYRSFFLSFGLMILVYGSIGAWPFFGKASVLTLDMNAQYVYFFSNLRSIICGEESLIYSWCRALGGEFLGIYTYYLASPLSWIVALFPSANITDAIWLMLVIKIGLFGLTMSIFLNKTHPTKTYKTILFSVLYAFNAYNLMYMHNIMWIDAVIWLPLLSLGIEQLVAERKHYLYTLSLAATIMSNYYIGYMVCIYVVLYFAYYQIAKGRKNGTASETEHAFFVKSFIRVVLFSLVAIAISAVVLFPSYHSLQFGKLNFQSVGGYYTDKQQLLNVLSKLYFGNIDTVRPTGKPFIYCGIITLLTFPLYFLSNQIKLREKLGASLVLVVFISSFSIHSFDMLWYAGHAPNWLNYRYSFLFCFFLVMFSYRIFDTIDTINFKIVLSIGISLSAILALIYFQHYEKQYEYVDNFHYNYNAFLVGGSFVAIWLLVLLIYWSRSSKRTGTLCLFFAIIFESYASGVLSNVALAMDVGYFSRDSYVDFIQSVQPSVDYIKSHDDDFFRTEKTFFRSPNDNMSLGLYGVSGATSTLNSQVLSLLSRFGYYSTDFISYYQGGSPVSDSLFGIKYVINDAKQSSDLFYELVFHDAENDRYVYRNPYSLSLAFAVSDMVVNMDNVLFDNPAEYLNALLSSMVGSPVSVFSTITGNWINDRVGDSINDDLYLTESCTYEITGTGNYIFAYNPYNFSSNIVPYVNGIEYESIFSGLNCLGLLDAGKTYRITLKDGEHYLKWDDDYKWLFSFDYEQYQHIFNYISENQLIYDDDITQQYIKGTIFISEERPILFTSIPYDENWKIFVDGHYVDPNMSNEIKVLDSLISIKLSPGNHEIAFIYQSNELKNGASVSLVGALTYIGIIFVSFIRNRRNKHKLVKK